MSKNDSKLKERSLLLNKKNKVIYNNVERITAEPVMLLCGL